MSKWGTKKSGFGYVPLNGSNGPSNQTLTHASKILKSETALCNSSLAKDYELILKGGCTYLPGFFCGKHDMEIFDTIKSELDLSKVVNWSQHFKLDDPTPSKTFMDVVDKMAKHFGVEVMQTRLNYYRNGTDFKPLHHDRHAYGTGADKIREDFTMGASFGASRDLDIVHVGTNLKFSFPQNNGDVFAFNSEVNKLFMHGIPKDFRKSGPRISIIAWGKLIK